MKKGISRGDMLRLLPPNSICAEIGVCEGEYSQIILDIARPSRLFLVDVWNHITLNYNDHNMVNNDGHEQRYRSVAKKFLNYSNSCLLRIKSDAMLEIFPEKYFDWIYVDADHSYEGCKKDLEIADKLTKDDSYILGHDYCAKFPGVIEAVNKFVEKNNYYLTLTSSDKNSSYFISKSQKAHETALLRKQLL
jgi:hypothetical protein